MIFFNHLRILFFILFFSFSSIDAIQFNLITTFYNETNIERQREYKRCILENIKNKFIKKIYLFYENPKKVEDFLKNDKIKIISIKKRPTFRHYFDFVNTILNKELVIIANTDIFFDETLGLLENYSFKNFVFALTRYNVPEYNGKWKRHNLSFDSWIFKAPLNVKTHAIIGTFISDLMVNLDLLKSGIKVINPSLTIKTWHVHSSDKRNYNKNPKLSSRLWLQIMSLVKLIPFTTLKKVNAF